MTNDNERKVGILTFHKSINCGSVLQAWALQRVLLKCGIKTEIIEYTPRYYNELYYSFNKCNTIKNIIKNLLFFRRYLKRKKQIHLFEQFRKVELTVSSCHYYFDSDFNTMKQNYYSIICGSDQIWNINIKDCDFFYFLPNVQGVKKIAFSVSINNADFTDSKYSSFYLKCVRDYSFISCRELDGVKKISSFIERDDVKQTVDPTLLLNKEDYKPLCNNEKHVAHGADFIFLYCVAYRQSSLEFAKKFSKYTGIKCFAFMPGKSETSINEIKKYGIYVLESESSPYDFLYYIRNAKYVITNSFHGTAFSIIFEKDFLCVNDRMIDNKYRDDKRIVDILSRFSLLDRYIKNEETVVSNINVRPLNYEKITEQRMSISKSTIFMLQKLLEKDT